MKMNDKSRKKLLILVSILLVFAFGLSAILLLFAGINPQTRDTTQTTGISLPDEEADILIAADDEQTSQQENAEQLDENQRIAFPVCRTVVDLYVASAPGRPADIGTDAPGAPVLAASLQIMAASSLVTVLNPDAGASLTAGETFVLSWQIRSERVTKINILLSIDGGAHFTEMVTGMDVAPSCDLVIPDWPSEHCLFQVDAYAGESLIGSGWSVAFRIAGRPEPTPTAAPEPTVVPTPAATPTPTAVPTPAATPTPTAVPTPTLDPNLHYTEADYPFINRNTDATRWFLFNVRTDQADKVVWQVSKTPFFGLNSADSLHPPGLLASWEMAPTEREFAIDFNALYDHLNPLQAGMDTAAADAAIGMTTAADGSSVLRLPDRNMLLYADEVLLPQSQYVLYVRAIALDNLGRCLGDPGEGLPVIYGRIELEPLADALQSLTGSQPAPEIQVADEPGPGPHAYAHLPDKGLFVNPADAAWGFSLNKIPADTVKIDLQVATSPFQDNVGSAGEPEGLVYRKVEDNLNYTPATRYYDLSFAEFAPPAEELADQTIRYYVRAVCYRPNTQTAGGIFPVFSETKLVYYTSDQSLENLLIIGDNMVMPVNQVEVASHIPMTQFLRYVPVQWEAPDWQKYFEVTRHIEAEEVAFSIKNSQTGDFLLPYALHMQIDKTMTREKYQAILDRMLPVGASFQLTITTSAWDEFWNDFFGLLSDIYNSVRQAYEGLKDTMVNFVADNFPLIDQDTRDLLRAAVRALLDTGLTAIGIPPTLPNFEALAEEGLDYCLEVAINEACASMGIPADQVTQEIRDQVGSELAAKIGSLAQINRANPLDVDYLKPSSQKQYRPAYVDILVHNFSDQPSPNGVLTIDYYSLKTTFYKFYHYVKLPIPSLQPDDFTIIRVYLREDIDTPYVDYKPVYDAYYWGQKGDCLFTVKAEYDLPDVKDAAAAQDLSNQMNPMMVNAFVYDHSPIYAYSYVGYPCDFNLDEDESVVLSDFWTYDPNQ